MGLGENFPRNILTVLGKMASKVGTNIKELLKFFGEKASGVLNKVKGRLTGVERLGNGDETSVEKI